MVGDGREAKKRCARVEKNTQFGGGGEGEKKQKKNQDGDTHEKTMCTAQSKGLLRAEVWPFAGCERVNAEVRDRRPVDEPSAPKQQTAAFALPLAKRVSKEQTKKKAKSPHEEEPTLQDTGRTPIVPGAVEGALWGVRPGGRRGRAGTARRSG